VPVERERRLREKLRHIERVLSDENLDLFPDFTKKLGILRALEYTSNADVVQLKGRVACEVNTCDELVLTELVFENVLEPLSCEEAVALLSAFVFQQRTDDAPELNENLNEAQARLVGIAQSLAAVQMDHGLEVSAA
jgi:antiviral helicase SKI2